MAAASLGGAAVPLLFRHAVDDGLVRNDPKTALTWTAAALLVGLGAAGATAGSGFLGAAIGTDLTFELRRDLYQHLIHQPVTFFARSRAGAIISRISHDAIDAQSLIQTVLGTLVGQGLTLIAAVAALVSLSPLAAVVTLLTAPLILIPVRVFGARLRRAGRDQAQARAAIQQHAGEHLNTPGALARDLYATHERDREEFDAMAAAMRQAVISRNRYFYTSSFLLAALGAVGVASIYAIAAGPGPAAISVGTVIAMAGLVQLMYQPLTQFATQGLGLNTAIVALERVFEVLDHNPPSHPAGPDLVVTRPVRQLRLNHVWYRHPGDEITIASLAGDDAPPDSNEWTVRDLDVALSRGLTAIVGPTGAGKTTTALLAAGIYQPTRGGVEIDGVPISDYDKASLRQAAAVISQDTFLLHASLRTNLRLGAATATDDQIHRALA
ncbi:MAG TPA: ABC transporter ATP-binding protein, partial [Microlunatus sp.]